MKNKVKKVLEFVADIALIYSALVMIFVAFFFLVAIPTVSLPFLILSVAIKIIPMISKKKEDTQNANPAN